MPPRPLTAPLSLHAAPRVGDGLCPSHVLPVVMFGGVAMPVGRIVRLREGEDPKERARAETERHAEQAIADVVEGVLP